MFLFPLISSHNLIVPIVTNIRTNYVHCAFTIDHYKECIQLARDKGYTISNVIGYNETIKKCIVLRHDIDFSLDYAHKLATYENRFGIKSSYYVYLHSETYNALAPENMEIIRKIRELGHEVGLHYDSRYDNFDDIVVSCMLNHQIDTLTQHNPSMTSEPIIPITNPKHFPIKYISDSGRNWRQGCMCQHIGKEDKLHILTHPIWVVGQGNSRQEIIHNMILDQKRTLDSAHNNIKSMLSDYDKELKQ